MPSKKRTDPRRSDAHAAILQKKDMAGGYGAGGPPVNVPAPDEGLSDAAKMQIARAWAMDAESGAQLAEEVRDRVAAMRDKVLRERIESVLDSIEDVLRSDIDVGATKALYKVAAALRDSVSDYGISDVVRAGQLLAATQTERARAFPFVRTVQADESTRRDLGKTEGDLLAEVLSTIGANAATATEADAERAIASVAERATLGVDAEDEL